jgi:hypothetical protein
MTTPRLPLMDDELEDEFEDAPLGAEAFLLGGYEAPSEEEATAAAEAEAEALRRQAEQMAEQNAEAAREAERSRKAALRAAYGDDFPLAMDGDPGQDDWVSWAKGRWEKHRAGVQDAIYDASRNRLFRKGIQWVSSTANRGSWREPPMPKDAVRAVDNQIGPALDWHLQVLSEQRPGFRFSPVNPDPDRQRKAQAMQLAVEYQFHRQKMRNLIREMGYHAQTDGCAFLLTWWNTEAGPWEELEAGSGRRPIGDVATKVYTIEQVRVSAEATATQAPSYWILRDVLPLSQAVGQFGADVADETDEYFVGNQVFQTNDLRFTQSPLYQDQRTVDRLTVFCEKCEALPEGLQLIVVGNKVVFQPAGLVCGRVPVVRVTDGSSSPDFYCAARMNEWIAPQMRVNMILSKWIESVRANAGGKFISKTGAIVGETFVGGQNSVIEVKGAAPISETLQPLQGFSVGGDAKELLRLETKKLEDRSGWNDNARGQFSSDQSGRAIIAIREQLERTFAPFVYAVSDAMTEWAECQVAWMRWGYRLPRVLAVVGANRPDLAREFSSVDFDEVVDVQVDAETLMPMPRTMRLFLLDQDLEKGIIDPKEYRRLRPFAYAPDSTTPYDVQEAKAKRVSEAIRMGMEPEAIVWQDDEAVHQDVLDRDIILAADVSPEVRAAAQERWTALANQAAQKQGAPPPGQPGMGAAPQQQQEPPGGGAPQGAPQGVPAPTPLPPSMAPTFGSESGLPAAPPDQGGSAAAPTALPVM